MLPRTDTSPHTPAPLPPCAGRELILSAMPAPCPGLAPVIRYAVDSGGKRLRSRLLVLSARTLHQRPQRLAEAAALVEVLHTGTILHDDVMDRARVRRHRPTVNRLWGDAVAVLAGDFLLAAVMDLALRAGPDAVPRLAVDTLLELVAGQMLETQNQGNLSLDEGTYLEIAGQKTGALFAASCRLGGLAAHGLPHQLRALEIFGRELGLAYQMLDDLRDYVAEEAETGKEPGRDLAEARVTLPLILALRNADRAQKQEIRRLFEAPDRRVQALRPCLRELGGFSGTMDRARRAVRRAVAALEPLPPGEARAQLGRSANRLLEGERA